MNVADNATVAFRGNRYSTPPGLAGVELTLRHRLGTETLEVHSPAGALLVSHRLAPAGAGRAYAPGDDPPVGSTGGGRPTSSAPTVVGSRGTEKILAIAEQPLGQRRATRVWGGVPGRPRRTFGRHGGRIDRLR